MDVEEAGPAFAPEVLLIGFGLACALFCPSSGELKRLLRTAPYELSRGEDGSLSLLSGPNAERTPVDDLMEYAGEEGPDGGLMLRQRREGADPFPAERLESEYAAYAISLGVAEDEAGIQKLDCEAYHFRLSKACWTVFWVYGYVTDALGLTADRHIRYCTLVIPWKHMVDELLPFVAADADSKHHFRISARAARARLRPEDEVPLNVIETQEADRSFSSFALLAVLAMYAARGVHKRRAVATNANSIMQRARAFLRQVIKKFVTGDAEFSYDFDDDPVVFKIMRCDGNVKVHWASVVKQLKLLKKASVAVDGEYASLDEVFVVVCADMGKHGLSESRREASKFVVATLCDIVSAAVELSKDTDLWLGIELCRLPVRKAVSRKRRLSPAFKISATRVAAAAKRIRTVSQLMSAKSVIEDGEAVKAGKEHKSSLQFANTERFNYIVSSLRSFEGCRSLGINCDGSTMGSDDLLAVNFTNGDKQLSAWGPPQVQRVLKWRKGVTKKYSVDDKKVWQGRIACFMKEPGQQESPAERRKRLNFVQTTIPRQATFNWLRDISNSMSCVTGLRWGDFMNQASLLEESSPLVAPVFCIICTDEEGKQPAGVNYLKWKKSAFVEHIRGPIHRRTNDQSLGFKESDHYKRMCANVTLYNLKYGPWQTSAFGEAIKEAAEEISENWSPNDPLLLRMFPGILLDRGLDASMNTEEHRKAFLQGLTTAKFITKKPNKCSLSRFNSYSLAAQEMDPDWTAMSWFLITLSIMQGWSKHCDEYFLPVELASVSQASSSSAEPPPPAVGMPAATNAAASSSSSSASSRRPPAPAAPAAPGSQPAPQQPAAGSAEARVKSRAAAKAAAKIELAQARARSTNTCHAAARMMADDDIKFESRLINFLMEAETVSAGVMLRDLKSAASCKKFYAGWSHWSFLQECKQMIGVMSDSRKLQRLGFTMEFPAVVKKNLKEGLVEWENYRCGNMWFAIVKQLKHRLGSMCWHTWGAPGMTAGMVSDDPELKARSIAFFRKVDLVMRRAKDSGVPMAVTMTGGQGLESPLMKWLRKAARQNGGEGDLPEVAAQVLDKAWGLQLNDKFIEDSLKGMREMETRDDTKKHVRRMSAWQCPTNLKLTEKYGRKEIAVTSAAAPPEEFQFQKCFSMTFGGELDAREKAELVMLSGVRGGQATWHTHTPASEQNRFADLAALVSLHDAGSFGLASEAWKTALVPAEQFVKYNGRMVFAVRVYTRAALVWPAIVDRDGLVELDMGASQLDFIVVTDLNQVEVFKCEVLSPAALMMAKLRPGRIGMRLATPGLTLEQWHTENCWAGLSESTLRLVYREFELTAPSVPESEKGDDVEVTLAVDLACKFNPQVTEEAAATKILAARYDMSGLVELPEIDTSWLRDNSLEKDAKDIEEFYKNYKEKREKVKPAIAKLRSFVRDCWEKSSGYEGPRPVIKAMSKAKVTESMTRLYAKLTASADTLLKSALPADVGVFTDTFNGRWKLTHRASRAQRSVSWTKAGEEKAACVALQWAWDAQKQCDGRSAMPPETVALCDRVLKSPPQAATT